MIELPSSSNFQNDVDIGSIIEAAIHFNDVGMVEKHLDLHFADELVGYFLLMQKLLLNDLQSTDKVGALLLHQIDSAVFAVAQLLQTGEIVNCHFSGFRPRKPKFS